MAANMIINLLKFHLTPVLIAYLQLAQYGELFKGKYPIPGEVGAKTA